MNPDKSAILTINGGSSSIKFALYETKDHPEKLMQGEVENIGSQNTRLNFTVTGDNKKNVIDISNSDYNEAVGFLIEWLARQDGFASVKAIGHRIVHGMQHKKPEQITDMLIEELKNISAYDPEHLPGEIRLIEIFKKHYPALKQVACFDTSFHSTMPQVARLLPIPRKYFAKGIQRYGFHGLSYSYLLEELERIAGADAANGKIIMAHLGNGASITAVEHGRSVDTSMGFTPTSGLPMSTRTGDLDPGVAWYLMQSEKISPEAFSLLINHQSGLLGVSETSSDMRELLKCKDTNSNAAQAIELFCYQTKKWIGSFAAVLGGIDTLIFAGGIGENAAEIRAGICAGLTFLGIELNDEKNIKGEAIISVDDAKVVVRVIKTNEELMIAKLVCDVLNN